MRLLHREMENYEDFFTAIQGWPILLQSSHEQATKAIILNLGYTLESPGTNGKLGNILWDGKNQYLQGLESQ